MSTLKSGDNVIVFTAKNNSKLTATKYIPPVSGDVVDIVQGVACRHRKPWMSGQNVMIVNGVAVLLDLPIYHLDTIYLTTWISFLFNNSKAGTYRITNIYGSASKIGGGQYNDSNYGAYINIDGESHSNPSRYSACLPGFSPGGFATEAESLTYSKGKYIDQYLPEGNLWWFVVIESLLYGQIGDAGYFSFEYLHA